MHYFNHRSTNASAESFNGKIKYFRMMDRGIIDKNYLLNSRFLNLIQYFFNIPPTMVSYKSFLLKSS
ncbi:transposase [Myroides sp. M-43]|nr:transposase [Myroides oncorhynchi]